MSLCLFAGLKGGWVCCSGHGFVPDRGKPAQASNRLFLAQLASTVDSLVIATLFFYAEANVFVS
jgi:hypothetical protein